MKSRVYGDKRELDYEAVTSFFSRRAGNYSDERPYVPTSYQDRTSSLEMQRDLHEKTVALPLLGVDAGSRVLDVGCGVGRWADSLCESIAEYVGVDFCQELLDIARKRLAESGVSVAASFHRCAAQELDTLHRDYSRHFSHALVGGVLMYVNDDDLERVLTSMGELMADGSCVYVRESVGLQSRLTLLNHYSEMMSSSYSAIYRTPQEYECVLTRALKEFGFSLDAQRLLYDDELSLHKETNQWVFIYRK